MFPSIQQYILRSATHFLAAVALIGTTAVSHASAVQAFSDARFTNPSGPTTAVYAGLDSNNFTWGTTAGVNSNRLIFNGALIDTDFGSDFSLGTLIYTNGSAYSGTQVNSVSLAIDLIFFAPTLSTQNLLLNLLITATPNLGINPDADADYLTIPAAASSASFLLGTDLYTLTITGFTNVVGDGYLFSSASEFHVREELSASADLIGRLERSSAEVSEPNSLPLLLTVLAVLLPWYGVRGRNSLPSAKP